MRYLSAHYVYPVSSPPVRNGIICVNDDGCIADVIDTGGKFEEREKLEFYNGILVPGFVNAHCHLELSHLRNVIKPHCGMSEFISSIVAKRNASDEIIHEAAKAADEEMTGNGIAAIGDISNNADTLDIKRNSRILYHTFIEMFGSDGSRSEEIFSEKMFVMQQFVNAEMPASVAPHAVYSVSRELWKLLFQSYKLAKPEVISIHHQENCDEKEINYKLLSEASRCLLVHNTFTTKDDLNRYNLHGKNFYFVICPRSNLFIQERLPDFQIFSSREICQNVCLGTDSLASNTSLSIIEEMKIIQQHAPEISLETIIQWATLNGAKALGFEHFCGSFEKGKKPGINLITGIKFDKMQLGDESAVKSL